MVITSCTNAPITERRQLKLIPESKLNMQAQAIYEKIKEKEKMSDDEKTLNQINSNYRVFIRWSKGEDINAACGQLATLQNE